MTLVLAQPGLAVTMVAPERWRHWGSSTSPGTSGLHGVCQAAPYSGALILLVGLYMGYQAVRALA